MPVSQIKAYMEGVDVDVKLIEERTGRESATHNRQLVPYTDEMRNHYA